MVLDFLIFTKYQYESNTHWTKFLKIFYQFWAIFIELSNYQKYLFFES